MKIVDQLILRCQFLVPEMLITMGPKLDKVTGAECQSGVKSTDTALAQLQALTLDAVGPLTDLIEKMAAGGESSEDTWTSKWWRMWYSLPLCYWGMPVPSSPYIARGVK